ncbi:MAG: cation-translocating P-type ATPase [Clostridiaceae bacterium]|nr:cation-translocating P-type ATPase [Clostridiaceae bacterium]
MKKKDFDVRQTAVSLLSGEEATITSVEEVERLLGSDIKAGLTDQEAKQRLEIHGRNELEGEKSSPFILKLFDQFKDFLILILIGAAIISAILGESIDAIIILAVVVINAILGAVQENQAEKALAALKKMSAPYARVIRAGTTHELPATELVPGDLVELSAGDIVPADIRLFDSSNLRANESALTGESLPVSKDAKAIYNEVPGIGDRTNMVFSGMEIAYGRGNGLVVSTAAATEIGKIADRLKSIEAELTPLQVNLNKLGKILGILFLFISAIVFGVGLLQGGQPLALFMTAISLAVAAIPEGLPAVVTIILALGMNRMAKENAIVKRLLAVETLGSVDTICTDKTGTLTQNEMTVTRLYAGGQTYQVTGVGYSKNGKIFRDNGENADKEVVDADSLTVMDRLLQIGALCNDAVLTQTDGVASIIGDPTEGAMLTVVEKGGLSVSELREESPIIWELPFDSERKMMSVGCKLEQQRSYSLTKGAPDNVIFRCDYEMTTDGVVVLTDQRREAILSQNSAYARKALRVLAFAYKEHADERFEGAEQGMVFVGFMGMIDPPRPEVRDAIDVCHNAGISVVMITGDHQETAAAIANDLKLRSPEDGIISGHLLEKMSDDELLEASRSTSVYARVSPEHKVRIVEALKRLGRIVSMTGDGVNDAPALKRADIGVAMGITGTEVAKGAADVILTDDNFGTIVSAVEEGRVIYSNIRKVVSFLLSCNVGEILVIFITSMIFGPAYSPLIPVQLLWLNLVTDSFPALALGRERAEEGIMLRQPRKKGDRILDRPMMWSIASQAVALFIAVFVAFNIGRFFYPDLLVVNGLTSHGVTVSTFTMMPQAQTIPSWGAHTYAFVALILSEILRVFSSRSEYLSVFKLGFFSNKSLNRAVLLSVALTLVVVYVPFIDQYFKTIPLNLRDWGVILVLILIPFLAGELFKRIYYAKLRKAQREL